MALDTRFHSVGVFYRSFIYLSRKYFTLCLLGNFSSSDFIQSVFFREKIFQKYTRVSNCLDPDQVRRFVRHDLGPNCSQRLPADDTRMQRVNQHEMLMGSVAHLNLFFADTKIFLIIFARPDDNSSRSLAFRALNHG